MVVLLQKRKSVNCVRNQIFQYFSYFHTFWREQSDPVTSNFKMDYTPSGISGISWRCMVVVELKEINKGPCSSDGRKGGGICQTKPCHFLHDHDGDFHVFTFRSARRHYAPDYRCSFCTCKLLASSNSRSLHERSQRCKMRCFISFGGYHSMEGNRC